MWATPRILFRQIERIRREASLAEFRSMCTEMDCLDLINRPLGKMSKGQRQRIAVSIVTCGNPRVLLLDEPSTGLDPGGRILVRNLIRRMTDGGATVMLNSHLLGEVERVCTTAAFISNGRLVAQGTLDELARFKGQAMIRTSATEAVKDFLGGHGYTSTIGEDGVRVALPDMSDFRALTGRLLESGLDFTGIELQREDLEDVFMRVMGGDDDVSQQP
jgi:ABC-2 type transport system ATP-binding protein